MGRTKARHTKGPQAGPTRAGQLAPVRSHLPQLSYTPDPGWQGRAATICQAPGWVTRPPEKSPAASPTACGPHFQSAHVPPAGPSGALHPQDSEML